VVGQVISSAIWQRALQSRQHLTEVPFEIKTEEDALPALARGVIDLAFKEDDGWVLVDYKTDSAKDTKGLAKHYAPQLEIYSRAWQECTSEKVKEASIYFVRTGETYRVL
jgi:ATP-dependent helicase/nuclease subunit A